MKKRGWKRNKGSKRQKFSREYAFSCMMKCGYCEATLTRRHWTGGVNYRKRIWQCVTGPKRGKIHCPHSKGVAETLIEDAFVKSYQYLFATHDTIIDDFMNKIEKSISDSDYKKELDILERKHDVLNKKKSVRVQYICYKNSKIKRVSLIYC